ncbi:MAG: LssY C-terminal domain-containing protein, partial [Deltaproteobacteria bacterium]|nr:LssY C-terminal domain-containing protein [Deltaproteobacteria bacterium]
MRKRLPLFWLLCTVLAILILIGCASSFQHRSMEQVHFQERAQTQVEGNVRVTAAVLSADETKDVFGVALYKKGIQPIWLEIENKDNKPTWFLPFSVDPDYFSPLEVTYPYHRAFNSKYNDQIDQHFLNHEMGLYLAPGSIRSGFVFTNLDLGTKSFNLDLVGEDNQLHTFTFFISVPGLRSDHQDVDFDNLYASNEIVSYQEAEFRKALRDLPCCVTNKDGTKQGGPINFVFVAHGDDLLRVLIRSGWNETATTRTSSSAKKDITSGIPQNYRYKPVEPLYYYGRPQDASFREPRAAGFERNKIRLWLS